MKAPGVTVTVYDYTVGLGFYADATEKDLLDQYALTTYFQTPEYDLDGLTLQGAVAYS